MKVFIDEKKRISLFSTQITSLMKKNPFIQYTNNFTDEKESLYSVHENLH
jgi:hypothetical protein